MQKYKGSQNLRTNAKSKIENRYSKAYPLRRDQTAKSDTKVIN